MRGAPPGWCGLYILDDDDEPVACYDTLAWERWYAEARASGRFRVCADYDEGDASKRVFVSTVFLGIDHGFGSGLPVLWETMAFIDGADVHQERYTSRDAAVVGHQRACEIVMRAFKQAAKESPHG